MASKRRSRPAKNKPASSRAPSPDDQKNRPSPGGADQRDARRTAFAWAGFVAVMLLCVAWALVHSFLVDAVTVRLCNDTDRNIPVEKRMPVFLSEIAFDGYMWNRHAEHLGENGEWRVRHTDFDNVPKGREVHWNSAFAWYLRGLGEIYRAFTGDSLRNSIFRMSIWANPIILALAIGIFSTLSARRFGPLCGAVIAIGMVSVPTFYEGFMPAYPDHHGLIAFTLLGMLFGVAWAGAGWVQSGDGDDFVPPRSIKQARHGMIFSAICGAAGFWISSVSTAVVLAGIGIALLVAALFFRNTGKKSATLRYHPELWKLWALWGAGASVGFYLLEYFPFNMGLRMEINHPFYALGWLGGGWILYLVSDWLTHPGAARFPWGKLVLPAAACAVLPATVLIGGSAVFLPNDPFNYRLYQNIAELLPLTTRIRAGGLTWQVAIGWFPVFLLAALVLQWVPKVGRGTRGNLIFLSVPILFITALQFYQVRWGMLAGPLYIALAGIVVPQTWRLVPPKGVARWVAAAVFLALGYVIVAPTFLNCFTQSWSQYRTKDKVPISPGQGLALLHRQMARAILDSAGDKPVVLLSSPNSSCLLSALGGFKTVGTLYWENVEGLKAAAAGLNAQNDQEALAFMQNHGITHVSLMSWENFIEPFFRILYPQVPKGVSFSDSFGKRALFDKVIPPWARPLAFPPSDLSKGLQQTVLMLQVTPGQSIDEAKTHLARYVRMVEGNPITAEITLKQILDARPGFVPARTELICLKLDQKAYDDVVAMSVALLASLPEKDREAELANLTGVLQSAGRQELVPRITGGLSRSAPAGTKP